MSSRERAILTRATIQQAIYRCLQGEEEIAEGRTRVLGVGGLVQFAAAPVEPIALPRSGRWPPAHA